MLTENVGVSRTGVASQGSGSAHSHTATFALAYVDIILAMKD
jgi:hypothetical protein